MPYVPDTVHESGGWKSLSGSEAKVYVVLCQHYNRKNRNCFPSIKRIVNRSGVSKRAVIYALDSLHDKWLIRKKKRSTEDGDSDSNLYILPDFLLYDYKILSKDPQQNVKEIMAITNILFGELCSAKSAPRSAKKTPKGAKNSTKAVQNMHRNYITNYINIITNSFNSSSKDTGTRKPLIVDEYRNNFLKDNSEYTKKPTAEDIKESLKFIEGSKMKKEVKERIAAMVLTGEQPD